MAQGLQVCASTAGDAGLIPGQRTKILCEARCGQKKRVENFRYACTIRGLPRWRRGKESACNSGDAGDLGYPLEEAIATHSSILAWRIPMDRGLQCMGLQRVGHDWVTKHCTAPSGSQGSLILLITFFHTFLYFFSYFYGIFFTCPCSPLAS